MRNLLTLAALVLSAAANTQFCLAQASDRMNQMIRVEGDKLYEGDREFRFISFNIPNLHLVEDNFAPDAESPFCWPNAFEIEDALESVRQMGGTVVRTYVLSVVREGSGMGDTVFVLGPGKFNEEAFRTLDLVLKTARDKGIRVLVPLVDQWHWMGGRAQYAGFRGREPDEFWTDDQVIADFETTICHLLCRRNTLTGVRYKDDPTIFGWETGNEIDPPAAWTKRIAAFIKSIDPKHLVIDGRSLHGVRQESLDDPNVDVVTTHHYPGPGRDMFAAIQQAREASRGKKPYFLGEFGFIPRDQVAKVLDQVIDQGLSGALIWSLRFHHRDGGFYWHSEPLGAGLYKAYHWPGFAGGAAYAEIPVLRLMRGKAFQIRGMDEPPPPVPTAPMLLPITEASAISWQGSAGASSYDVFRALAANGPWELVGPGVIDADWQYAPLFHDDSAQPGESYFYRVVARGDAGSSPPSNTVGPMRVTRRALVDECDDLSSVKSHDRAEPTTGSDRNTREDQSRLKLSPGGYVVYELEQPIDEWTVSAFLTDDQASLRVTRSADGTEFSECDSEAVDSGSSGSDYGYLRHVTLHGTELTPGTRFLRLELPATAAGDAQLSRVVIYFGSE
jgi:mannan endo-1,4-beta-mannosidase